MTHLEKLWHAFEQRTLPAVVPAAPRFAIMQAYHQGALAALEAVALLDVSTPEEAQAYLSELESYSIHMTAQTLAQQVQMLQDAHAMVWETHHDPQ